MVATLWVVTALAACSGASTNAAESPTPGSGDARAIRGHVCARCHALPEAGQHTRVELEAIVQRHRTRARLTPRQWESMIDLLAIPDETREAP